MKTLIAAPADKRRLAPEDYNFDEARVPVRDLVPCLLWEFLRESATVRLLADDWAELIRQGKEAHAAGKPEPDQRPLWERVRALGIRLNCPLRADDFISKVVVQACGFQGAGNTPWQKLSCGGKEWLAEPCVWVNRPVFIGSDMHASELSDYVRKLEPSEAGKAPDGTTLYSLPKARAPLKFFKPPGQASKAAGYAEAICIVVDWGRYDNKAIDQEFKKLAKEIIKSRPIAIKPEIRKGWGIAAPGRMAGQVEQPGANAAVLPLRRRGRAAPRQSGCLRMGEKVVGERFRRPGSNESLGGRQGQVRSSFPRNAPL